MSGTAGGGTSGGGADPGIGPQLEKLRRDNSLANVVHDPDEDEPRIIGLVTEPGERAIAKMPTTRHNWVAIILVAAIILGGVIAAYAGAAGVFWPHR